MSKNFIWRDSRDPDIVHIGHARITLTDQYIILVSMFEDAAYDLFGEATKNRIGTQPREVELHLSLPFDKRYEVGVDEQGRKP